MGAKYSTELGYDRLYHCVAIAEQENGRGIVIANQAIRDLRTNTLVSGQAVLAEPEPCRRVFSAERWAEFRADVDYFRTRVGQQANQYFFMDHGYNASPFWTLLNRPLVSRTRASDTTLVALAWIDIVLLTAIFALLWSTFGLETAALAAVLWGTGSIWIYGQLGNMGSFGRMYWLLAVVAAVCLLKRGWFLLGGIALSIAVLDRIFPAALLFGPALLAARDALQRRFESRLWRMLVGAGLGVVVLSALALIGTGGTGTAAAFLANSSKHASTPLTNYVGLPTLAATTPASTKASISNEEWRELRRSTFSRQRAAYWAIAALLLAYTGWVCWMVSEPWKLLIAGLLPMFCVFDLTNYYYAALILLAPLAAHRLSGLLALLGASMAGQVILQHGWEELIFPLYSLLVLAVLLYFLGAMALDARASGDRPIAGPSARW
jgi:hypothetical protein